VKRSELKRKTALKPGKPMARQRMKKTSPPPGFPEPVRMAARRRSGGRCEARSTKCSGEASHFHHRKLRRSKDHRLENCLHVCWTCHEYMHANPMMSMVLGWIVPQHADPAEIPVKQGDASLR
jgi:hypothetical protein